KVDRITLALLHDIPGVNGEQVLSITHPKVKTTLTAGSGIKVVPLMYPRVPESKDDLDFLKLKVYSTEGVHGLFVSEDDKATQIIAGFWEEYFDLPTMWVKIQEIVKRESDDKNRAIVKSYTEIYAPAMVSLLADGLAILTLLVARIPIIQKLAILCSFWIISIFVSVVTLHPIILSFTPPPSEEGAAQGILERFMA